MAITTICIWRLLPPPENLVLIEERPFEARDYTGGEATTLYQQLRQRAVVTSLSDVVETVSQILQGDNKLSEDA